MITTDVLERVSILEIYSMVTGFAAGTHPHGVGHYLVRCPVEGHEDKDPSCILNEGTSSWKCFGCKEKGGKLHLVVAAGLADDFRAASEYVRSHAGQRVSYIDQPPMQRSRVRDVDIDRTGEKLVGTYRYRDENGDLLCEFLRYETGEGGGGRRKRFVGRRPDGPGRWKYSLAGVRRVPYRLPELIAALTSDRVPSVLVVEGEKHADALAALGFTATTNATGVSFDWPDTWAGYFYDAPVVFLLPDADTLGRKAMEQRAALLRSANCETVIADLFPDRMDGSDVLNWLAENCAGLTRAEQRRKMIETLTAFARRQ